MSFLDNLENNLKAFESSGEADAADARRRESDDRRRKAAGPWAERLRNGDFSKKLMQQATRAGFAVRTRVHIAWIGTTLRLEARNQRLELHPSPEGVFAVFLRDREEMRRERVDLDGDPALLVSEWMPMVEEQKRKDDEAARAAAEAIEE